jgi:flagellar biosynthesis component FlhA
MIAVDELLGDEAIERLLAETNRQYPLLVNEIWAKRVLQAVLGVS